MKRRLLVLCGVLAVLVVGSIVGARVADRQIIARGCADYHVEHTGASVEITNPVTGQSGRMPPGMLNHPAFGWCEPELFSEPGRGTIKIAVYLGWFARYAVTPADHCGG